MNVFINIAGRINARALSYLSTCGKATKSVRNNMGQRISEFKSETGSVLRSALAWSIPTHVSCDWEIDTVIGKTTRRP